MPTPPTPSEVEPLEETSQPRLFRALGPVEGTCIVVGTVMGSGIFRVPSSVAGDIGGYGFGMILAIWILCGILSLGGALAYAELAAMFPRSGGQYVYLREAYGPLWGFLFGWMEFWVARPGSIAALAVVFAEYSGQFTHLDGDWGVRWTAFLMVFLLTWVNYVGVRWGGTVQVVFTATKVAALLALIACSFGLPAGTPANWTPLWSQPAAGLGLAALVAAVGKAMISILWTYDGWANGAAVSEEMKDPQRDVPRALIGGTLLLIGIYLLANLAYHYVFPIREVIANQKIAAAVAERLFGTVGAGLVSAAVMISTFGAVNGLLLTGPRIFFAMSQDRLFFKEMGELHVRFRTPHWSILFQGLWAGLLILVPFQDLFNTWFGWKMATPLYDQLITYVIFASWAFYGMTVAGIMILRKKLPEVHRPYRAWGYPVVPFLFVLTSVAFVAHTLYHSRAESVGGLIIVLLGLPAYFAWSRSRSASVEVP